MVSSAMAGTRVAGVEEHRLGAGTAREIEHVQVVAERTLARTRASGGLVRVPVQETNFLLPRSGALAGRDHHQA